MPDISIGRLRGGFCVYWRDDDGTRKRYQLAARTRAEAEAEAIDVYRRHRPKPRTQTIRDLWEAYRQDLGEKPTAETMRYTGKAVLAHFGAYRPDQITKALCKEYAAVRSKAGKSQGTIHTELGHLRSTLVHHFGPNEAPNIWRPNKPDSTIRVLSAGEVRRLIDACEMPHVKLAVILLFGTGARCGAILDLTWDRVDFEQGTINLRLPDTVTRKGRALLPMNTMTRAALTSAAEAALTDYVVEYAGKPIRSIRTGVKAALKRAGLPDMRIHDFRHTAAVTMLGAGMPIEKVAQVLGHSNHYTTFKVYARFLPSQMQDAVDVLDFSRSHSAAS